MMARDGKIIRAKIDVVGTGAHIRTAFVAASLAIFAVASTPEAKIRLGTDHQSIQGATTLVETYEGFNMKSCSFSSIEFRVVDKPLHGKLIPKFSSVTIPTFSQWGKKHSNEAVEQHRKESYSRIYGNCGGKKVKALKLYYKSNPRYVGSDTFTVDDSKGIGRVFTINVIPKRR